MKLKGDNRKYFCDKYVGMKILFIIRMLVLKIKCSLDYIDKEWSNYNIYLDRLRDTMEYVDQRTINSM